MTTTRGHLSLAEAALATATAQLQFALDRATQFDLPANYIAAIKRAIADNQATWLHVGNIATLLPARPQVPPH